MIFLSFPIFVPAFFQRLGVSQSGAGSPRHSPDLHDLHVPVRHPQAAAGCARMQATPGIPWEEMKYIYIYIYIPSGKLT